jgi:hypothetical protein
MIGAPFCECSEPDLQDQLDVGAILINTLVRLASVSYTNSSKTRTLYVCLFQVAGSSAVSFCLWRSTSSIFTGNHQLSEPGSQQSGASSRRATGAMAPDESGPTRWRPRSPDSGISRSHARDATGKRHCRRWHSAKSRTHQIHAMRSKRREQGGTREGFLRMLPVDGPSI